MDVKKLCTLAATAMDKAYAPYSTFLVGASIETSNGNIYSGCNIENASYGLTTCAESCAISAMIVAGDHRIKQIAVMTKGPGLAAPCGACRQRIYEFSLPDTVVHLGNLAGEQVTYSMSELLPHAFGRQDLDMGTA